MTQEDFDTATGADRDRVPLEWCPGTFDEYERNVLRTSNDQAGDLGLVNWALGLAGEAGEYADLVKKAVFHGHELDRDKALKELGDALWYIARAAHQHGSTLADVAEMNVRKLRARYPNGWSSEDSIARRDVG